MSALRETRFASLAREEGYLMSALRETRFASLAREGF
jgi:hypothetical protein